MRIGREWIKRGGGRGTWVRGGRGMKEGRRVGNGGIFAKVSACAWRAWPRCGKRRVCLQNRSSIVELTNGCVVVISLLLYFFLFFSSLDIIDQFAIVLF